MSFYINVILPIALDTEFTYEVTKDEAYFLKPGMRVAVPFGKTKVYAALVIVVHQSAPQFYEAKEIEHILDETPIVTENQLRLWSWIASYYMCTRGEVMRAALPGAFLLESETIIRKNDEYFESATDVSDEEYLLYEALQHQSLLRIQEVMDIIGKKTVLPVIKSLLEKKVIVVEEELYEQYKPKLVEYVKSVPELKNNENLEATLENLTRAPRQKEMLLHFFVLQSKKKGSIKVKDLIKTSKSSRAILNALIEKKILQIESKQVDRIHYDKEEFDHSKKLNEFQEQALSEIQKAFQKKSICLLHGVTSSGKTEIYVKLIEDYLQRGQQVLYLLPEIALTTQLITRLQLYFGDKLSVYHSKYSVHERVEVWNNTKNKQTKAQLIVGARSAIFLPFNDLGLIIVDEEHESSYKQFDPAPRYHARDTAIVLATYFSAKVLLGSATPAIESFYNAQQDKYELVSLKRRYGNVLLPEINLIDLKNKYKKKQMKGHFSDILLTQMQEALRENEQIILFQNRRGYAPIVECHVCGHAPQCPNCDVSLTFHQHRNQLRCHYCGYHMAMMKACLACGSSEMSNKGFGTEQIEKELNELFPEYAVGRMDQDTTRGKHAYEKIIHAFEEGETQILVGTQMLAKGLDFRKVSLVGIMNADSLLNFSDFRAHERSFQLLQQVAGRAGRTKKQGKVLIQTYNPYHQILQQVTVNDYEGMFRDQLEERKQYKYPPFFRTIRITGKHKDYSKVNEATEWFAKSLRLVFKENILGPEFPPVSRIRNQYHKHIIVKIPSGQSITKTKEAILKIQKTFRSIKNFSGVRLIMNVDY